MELKDILSLTLGAVGTVLGVANTLHSIWFQHRVRLRVRPRSALQVAANAIKKSSKAHTPESTPCIEVTNLSGFAVTVAEVGYTRPRQKRRSAVPLPSTMDGKGWPRRLEPRESVSAYFAPDEFKPGTRIGRAYAKTECGVVRHGSSPALRQFRRELLAGPTLSVDKGRETGGVGVFFLNCDYGIEGGALGAHFDR
jgi:hypothetical protein